MYHEVTYKDQAKRRKRTALVLLALIVVVAVLVVALQFARAGAREQGAAAMRKAIMDAAVRCCAVEGSHPLTLSHLEQDYGLRVNHKDYVITYEAYASNMAPTVVVVPR